MKNPQQKIMLSIFVIVALAAFTFGIFYIGQNKNMFSSTIKLSSTFKNVNGLKVGNNVRFAGIKAGSVSDIVILNDTTIKVEIYVEEQIRKFIKKDSKMAIGSDGLMGDKLVEISPGRADSKIVDDNDALISVKPLDMDIVIKSAQRTLSNLEEISGQVSQIAYKVNNGTGLVHALLEDKSMVQSAKRTLGNMEVASGNLAEDLEAAKHNVLLRGFFKKKKDKIKEAEEAKEDAEKERVKAEKDKERQEKKEQREKEKQEKKEAKEREKQARKEAREKEKENK